MGISGNLLKTEKAWQGFKIVMEDLSQVYRLKSVENHGNNRLVAIEHFTLQVRQGEFLAIVGPSGCGKSTLLDILAGLAKPSSGRIIIDGQTVSGPALDRGIVMQGYALFPWRTVRKNVEFGLEVKGVPLKRRAEISRQFINLVGLTGFEDRYPYELSGGMRQRVAIARALAYDPDILLMDEPFAAVDAQTREILQDELLGIWEKTGKTIIFVTHSIDEAVLLADRVVVMTAHPGTIKEVVGVDLPRPRSNADMRASASFNRIRRRVWDLLQQDKDTGQSGQSCRDQYLVEGGETSHS